MPVRLVADASIVHMHARDAGARATWRGLCHAPEPALTDHRKPAHSAQPQAMQPGVSEACRLGVVYSLRPRPCQRGSDRPKQSSVTQRTGAVCQDLKCSLTETAVRPRRGLASMSGISEHDADSDAVAIAIMGQRNVTNYVLVRAHVLERHYQHRTRSPLWLADPAHYRTPALQRRRPPRRFSGPDRPP